MRSLVQLFSVLVLIQASFCVVHEESWEANVGMKPGKYPKGMGEYGPEWGSRMPRLYPKDLEFVRPDIELFPPKFFPGMVIDKMEFSEVDKALNDVMRSGNLMHDRRCALSASNKEGTVLVNPKWFLHSGGTHSSPGPEIQTEFTGLNLFLKTPWALRGTAGVVTYDIRDTDFKLAIMWSVPYDRNIYKNWFNFKIYPQSFATDSNMYDQMYYYSGPWLAQGWQERTEYGINVRGVMTDNIHAKVSVWVETVGHQPEEEPEIWADCDYHAGWVGKYCWRECTPRGWCWVNRRCSSRSDCANLPLECYSSCKKT